MESYQENFYDLLSNKQRNESLVNIREEKGKDTKIINTTEINVKNAEDAIQFMTQGAMHRVIGATMNAHSSRAMQYFHYA